MGDRGLWRGRGGSKRDKIEQGLSFRATLLSHTHSVLQQHKSAVGMLTHPLRAAHGSKILTFAYLKPIENIFTKYTFFYSWPFEKSKVLKRLLSSTAHLKARLKI